MTRDVTVQCMVLRCDRALMQYIQIHVIRVPMLCSVYLSFRRQLTIRQAQTLGILFGPLCFSVVMEAVAPPPSLVYTEFCSIREMVVAMCGWVNPCMHGQ